MKKGIILTLMIGMLLTCNIGCSSEKKPDIVPTKEEKPTVAPTKEDNSSGELSRLKEKVPEYFNLNTTKGLEVCVCYMSKDACTYGLFSGTNRGVTALELMKLKGVNLEEMKLILSTYDLPKDHITVIPYQHPVSSHMLIFDDADIDKLYDMLGLTN